MSNIGNDRDIALKNYFTDEFELEQKDYAMEFMGGDGVANEEYDAKKHDAEFKKELEQLGIDDELQSLVLEEALEIAQGTTTGGGIQAMDMSLAIASVLERYDGEDLDTTGNPNDRIADVEFDSTLDDSTSESI